MVTTSPTLISNLRSFLATLEAWLLITILVLALIVQIIYFLNVQSGYASYGLSSTDVYTELAANFKNHGLYGLGEETNIKRETERPPFYASILVVIYSIVGERPAMALIFNNLVLWLTIAIVYFIGRTIDPRVGLLAALIFALDPAGVVNANKNGPAALYSLLIGSSFLAAINLFTPRATLKIALLGSILLALATLTRGPTLYIGVAISIALIAVHKFSIRQIPTKAIIMIVVAFFSLQMLLVGLWVARNNATSGHYEYGGMSSHLYERFIPALIAKRDGTDFKKAVDQLQLDLEQNKANRPEKDQRSPSVSDSTQQVLKDPARAAVIILQQIPVLFLDYPHAAAAVFFGDKDRNSLEEFLSQQVTKKPTGLDLRPDSSLILHFSDKGPRLAFAHIMAFKLIYFLVMLAGVGGLVLFFRDAELRPWAYLFLVVLVYLVIVFATWPANEYRLSLMPVYAPPAAFMALWIWDRLLTLVETIFALFRRKTPEEEMSEDKLSDEWGNTITN